MNLVKICIKTGSNLDEIVKKYGQKDMEKSMDGTYE